MKVTFDKVFPAHVPLQYVFEYLDEDDCAPLAWVSREFCRGVVLCWKLWREVRESGRDCDSFEKVLHVREQRAYARKKIYFEIAKTMIFGALPMPRSLGCV